MRLSRYQVFCALYFLIWASVANAELAEEEDMLQAYGDKSFVSIATGNQQAVSRAPSVASVVTAQDIEAMGATDLSQVLESIPGVHVSVASIGYDPIYSLRGIHSNLNNQVLLLINGIPINNVYSGNNGPGWGGMPLENVARVEVIRGPGSALYGADAFSGVINVITKTAADMKGSSFGVRLGSFNTRDAWIQHGGKLGSLDAALYLRIGKTDGQDGVIQQDAQSSVDKFFGTSASLAPGQVNTKRSALDTRIDLSRDQWRFRASYQKREVGIGAGFTESLDPNSRIPTDMLLLDLTYEQSNWRPDWDVFAVAGYDDFKQKPLDTFYTLFPAGAFNGAFPNGVLANPGHSERHTHVNLATSYKGFKQHRIRLGAGARTENLYEVTETKNYTLVSIPGCCVAFQPLGSMVDATGNPSLVYMQPHKRNVTYTFVQDEWSLADDWMFTAGLRQDHYSDFGSTTNPRLALVWDAAYNIVVKALYGRAFRAPSFTEQYNINTPVLTGNPSLKPETISTSELALSWQPTMHLRTNLSIFQYHMYDIIRFAPNADPSTGSTAQNTGSQTGRGFELEAVWEATQNLKLMGSFSLQHARDDATNEDSGLAPHRRFFVRSDWNFMPLWQLGTVVNRVMDRQRQPGDTRAPIPDYTTVGLTVQRKKVLGDWDIRASISNLFNQDAREPSFLPGNIPYDLPLPGRTFYVQFEHAL